MARTSASMRSASAAEELLLDLRALARLAKDRLLHRMRLRVMPPVRVVGGAGAFGGDHRGAEGISGVQAAPERRTVMRLLEAAKDLAADAGGGLQRLDRANLEATLGIELAELVAKPQAALGNAADAAPLSGRRPRRPTRRAAGRPGLPCAADDPRVLVLHVGLARLELTNGAEHAIEEVDRLEARDHDGDLVARAMASYSR